MHFFIEAIQVKAADPFKRVAKGVNPAFLAARFFYGPAKAILKEV